MFQSGNSLKAVSRDIHKDQHFCFLSLMDCHPLFFLIQCVVENHYFISFAHFLLLFIGKKLLFLLLHLGQEQSSM